MPAVLTQLVYLRYKAGAFVPTVAFVPRYRFRAQLNANKTHRARVDSQTTHRVRVDAR